MYRFLFILIFLLILTVGCQPNNNSSSNTPKEALERIHIDGGYAEVVEIYETIEIGEDRVISVYKGAINNSEEIFVANIEQVDGRWLVTDAQNIGMPSADRLNQSSVTEKFKAGFADKHSFLNEEIKIIELSDSNFKIWIEVF
ncbi:hypothetical protein PB01_14405 [Psychrobacillus glaciei]|uniref:Uncharacterized protein n=1 Tax=Psychrobacillus glaciei TaxID=2283160 RepID=A0A5J6SPL9_9BACI|nr:hypothetical protein [Psychrobacillus glaciei]QFF99918.1 hypothetical protein PB01_14405 [Psychrobacillus glaciei]